MTAEPKPLRHLDGCLCDECQAWFSSMTGVSGRHSCGRPVDEHVKDKHGSITECPR